MASISPLALPTSGTAPGTSPQAGGGFVSLAPISSPPALLDRPTTQHSPFVCKPLTPRMSRVSRPSARPSMCPPTPLKRKRVSDRSRGSAWTGPDLSPRPESCVKKPSDDFVVLGEVGVGSYHVVHKVRSMADGNVYALRKSVAPLDAETTQFAKREQELFARIGSHPNIVRCYSSWLETDRMCFLLEYCSRGSLTHLLRHACGPIPEAAVWHMLHDLAQGLHHLHSLGIVHMDVKPSNVLVDESWRLKLSDFEIGFVLPEHASESHLTPLSFPTFAFSSELRPFTPPSVRSPHSSFKRLIPAIPPLPPVPTLTSSVDSPKPWNTSKASPDGVCDVAVSSSALPMCLPTLSEAKRPANLSLTSLNLCLDRDGVSPCASPAPSPMGLLSSSFQPVPSRRMPAASECHLAQEPSASSAEVDDFSVPVGDGLYAAPEVFKSSGKRPPADMYSLGRSLLEIGWGIDLRRLPRTPVEMSATQLKAWLAGASATIERSAELLELTASLLSLDPECRPTAEAVLRHDLVQFHAVLPNTAEIMTWSPPLSPLVRPPQPSPSFGYVVAMSPTAAPRTPTFSAMMDPRV